MGEESLDKRFSVHEAVCAERWRETILRIKRLEAILIGCAGAIILALWQFTTNLK